MAIGQVRVNGAPAAGAFYGYQPLVLKIAATNVGTADSGGNGSAIVEGNYTKTVRAVQQLGSMVVMGAQTNNTFACIVDAATFNNGAGLTTSGAFGALKDAVASATGIAVGNITVTSSSTLNGDGTFTFA